MRALANSALFVKDLPAARGRQVSARHNDAMIERPPPAGHHVSARTVGERRPAGWRVTGPRARARAARGAALGPQRGRRPRRPWARGR